VQYPATPLRTYYEELFATKFSMDVLPDPDDLFTHPGTGKIFSYFVRDFTRLVSRRKLSALIDEVDAAAVALASRERRIAQYLRIEAVSLRHLPYLTLEALLDRHDEGSLLETSSLFEAVPWLAGFERHAAHLEALCRTHTMAAA
jgi:hypothetical protein